MLTDGHSDHAAERGGFDPRYTHDIVDWGALKIEWFVLCGRCLSLRIRVDGYTSSGVGCGFRRCSSCIPRLLCGILHHMKP